MRMQNVEDVYPLSPMQQGMLFHTLYAPESRVYLTQTVCTLSGNVDVDVFERAWKRVVDRHPVLRTAFVWQGFDEPLQVVRQQVTLPWEYHDWQAFSPKVQQEKLEAFLLDDRARGFDLIKAPLMRFALFRLTGEKYQLVWSNHHMLLDGWSLPLLLREAFVLYEVFYYGEDIDLPLPRPYRDYIAWLQKQDLTQAEAFWREQLQGFTAPMGLSVERWDDHAPDREARHGKLGLPQVVSTWLSTPTTTALQALVRRHRLTLNVLTQGAWAVLLSRYSGTEDVLFGATFSGRPVALPGAESMIGLFINTLPVRLQVSLDPPFLAWLQDVQRRQVELQQHEYSPLINVQEWSQVPRGTPLFESLFVFENYPTGEDFQSQNGSLTFHELRGIEETNYPLTVKAAVVDRRMNLQIKYDDSRFDEAITTRMVDHLKQILENIAADPEQKLADISLLTEAEWHQLLVEWNDTRTDYPQDKCIHELFEVQAEKNPAAVAVVFEENQYTYRELNQRANQMARYLQSLGVKPDVRVGLCVERSLDIMVGLLGILKAGGAYVPLDPIYPQDRIRFMLEDAQVPILLTQRALAVDLPDLSGVQVIYLDGDWDTIAQHRNENLLITVTPSHLMYVLFTSGSTGRPKAVALEHRHYLNYLHGIVRRLKLSSGLSFAIVSTFAADLGTTMVFGSICTGGQLHIISYERAADSEALADYFRRHPIDVLKLVPSHFEALQTLPDIAEIVPHQRLIFAGEACYWKTIAKVRAMDPDSVIQNHYGPAETTVATLTYSVPEKLPQQDTTAVPLGRPLSNTRVYILDTHMRPVPSATPGELYIGGEGVTRGYVNRPALTAGRFIPDPFSRVPGARLYRTGDLARYLPDGNVEFLGRVDHQVKMRGFRIELGEIETVLGTHPAVCGTVVLVREDEPGEKRLVAYVVTHEGQKVTVSDLRRFLMERLPEYMVPSAFVALDALPLTPNGKVDRRALPAPSDERPELEGAFVSPRTQVEEMLANIWGQVFGVEQVGAYDNFFELGGHSLLAMQVTSRAREAFQVGLSLRDVIETATLAELAERVEKARQGEELSPVPPLQPVSRDGELPLSFAQQRLWFISQLEPGSVSYNVPNAVRGGGELGVEVLAALQQSLQEIVRRHEVLRTSFTKVAGRPVQVIAPSSSASLLVADLRAIPPREREDEMQRVATEVVRLPFDLERGPLLRPAVLWLDEAEYVLVLTTHHIVSDAWSMEVFLKEMTELCRAFLSGEKADLPELPIQYADFAHWQREWLQGEVLEQQLSYWKRQLGGEPAALELPVDHQRPLIPTYRGAMRSFKVAKSTAKALDRLSREENSTQFMTLLAAFMTLLYRYTGQEDILIGTPIANRNRSEIESLIGFFVNTLVLRTAMGGNPTFRESMGRVRQVTLEAYAHQDLPFEMLVDELQTQRDMSRTPLFQVMFVYRNTPTPEANLSDLALSPLEVDSKTAKFDLTLFIGETEDGLSGTVEYSTDLFSDERIARLVEHFRVLLDGIAANPDQHIAALPLLTEAEQRQVLEAWNDTATDYGQDKSLHGLFEAQAARTPDVIAAVLGDQHLSYRELNRRANQLAHYLQTLGVRLDVVVGLHVERSLEMVVGLLGILKAGGAYLPLDLAYPQERLAFMLADAQAPVLLTQAQKANSERAIQNLQSVIVCLDADWNEVAQESSESLVYGNAGQENLTYAIYTSGSTGRPKGVAMRHQALLNLILWQLQNSAASVGTRTVQFSPISFDVSFQEIFSTWCSGGTLILLSEEIRRDAGVLLRFLIECGIERLFLPFVGLHQLAEAANRSDKGPACLREVITAGEQLQITPAIAQLFKDLPNCRLHNHYGPSEAHVVTAYPLSEVVNEWSLFPAIGVPIANTQIYLLDRFFQPVPIGVPGELYIGGDCLARGYLNHPHLTAEKFIPNPLACTPADRGSSERRSGSRLYCTGDLARYQPDGNIEFLKRIDAQVKIRGFRVEPGESEAVLAQHSAVREAVVVPYTPEGQGTTAKMLVAYVVLDKEKVKESGDDEYGLSPQLRRFMREKLPEYMIPTSFVSLDALPLNPNGKVDRKSLPAPSSAQHDVTDDFVHPRDPIELRVAQIWEDVLGVRPVGVRDNFFDLGGHSLLAAALMAQVEMHFGQELPLAILFQQPTVEGLASVLRQKSGFIAKSMLVAIQPQGSKPPFFCVHPAGGNVICYTDLARCLGPDQPFYGLQDPGLFGQESLSRVETMAGRYLEALREVQPEGPYRIGGWSFGSIVAYEMAQQLRREKQEVALLALFDYTPPLYNRRAWLRLKRKVRRTTIGALFTLGFLLHQKGIRMPGFDMPSNTAMAAQILEEIGRMFGKRLNISLETFAAAQMGDASALQEQFGSVGIDMAEADLEYMVEYGQRYAQVYRRNTEAVMRYVPRPYPHPITLFRVENVLPEDLEINPIYNEPMYGWDRLSPDVKVYTTSGTHHTILYEPHVQSVAEYLKGCLEATGTQVESS